MTSSLSHHVVLGKERGYVEEFISRDIVQFIENICYK